LELHVKDRTAELSQRSSELELANERIQRRATQFEALAQVTQTITAIRDGDMVGFGVARPCRVGVKVGPLFADDEATADALFEGLSAWTGDQPIFLDVPETNAAARRLAERHGMSPVFATARMYAGEAPDEPVDRIFGVTTFELG
jgi:hypothetical protein